MFQLMQEFQKPIAQLSTQKVWIDENFVLFIHLYFCSSLLHLRKRYRGIICSTLKQRKPRLTCILRVSLFSCSLLQPSATSNSSYPLLSCPRFATLSRYSAFYILMCAFSLFIVLTNSIFQIFQCFIVIIKSRSTGRCIFCSHQPGLLLCSISLEEMASGESICLQSKRGGQWFCFNRDCCWCGEPSICSSACSFKLRHRLPLYSCFSPYYCLSVIWIFTVSLVVTIVFHIVTMV